MDYNENSIKRKKGVSHVRLRPAMYISDTGSFGLHHCVKEAIDNVIDEMESGNAKQLTLTLHTDGSCSVSDDGRGIPVGNVDDDGVLRPAVEIAVGELNSGGKFDTDSYKTSAGLHGVGIKATNATSEFFIVTVYRDGFIWEIKYEKGVKVQDLKKLEKTKLTGTTVHFKPDIEIFPHIKYTPKILKDRLIEISYLLRNKKFVFIDEEKDTTDTYHNDTGLNGLLLEKLNNKKILHEPIYVEKENKTDKIKLESSFVYTDADDVISIYSYVNNVYMGYAGTHVDGFKNALWTILKNEIVSHSALKSVSEQPRKDDALDGLVAILSIKMDNPEFQGQTKDKLGNEEVKDLVYPIILEKFQDFIDKNPKVRNEIVEKAVNTILAREAAKNAKAHARRKNVFKNSTLPGKLADCTIKEMEGTEIFVVEGDSAAGIAKQARVSEYQAVLPLRGKILNTEKQDSIAVLIKNEQIETLMAALGISVLEERDGKEIIYKFEVNLRYENIILMTDADVDGSHIVTLALTFFYNHTPQIITDGHLYLAVPPLFRVIYNKVDKYIIDESDLKKFMVGKDESKVTVYRFKGLGEMEPEQLRDTVMNRSKRTLIKLTLNDLDYAKEIIGILMGKDVEPRRQFIETHALEANLDI